MADLLITWVDVQQKLRACHEAGDWPEGLNWAEVYWTGVRLHLSPSADEHTVRNWLEAVFAPRLKDEQLELDSGVALPVDFELDEFDERGDERADYVPSFSRPTRVPGPRPAIELREGEDLYEPPLVAFHSYKGGVGRTTHALAFALEAVAYSGGKVLLVDGDVEAPGLSWHIRDRYPEPAISYADLLILAHGDEDPNASASVAAVAKRLANQEDRGLYVLPSFREGFRWEALDIRPDHLVAGRSSFAVSDLLVALGVELGVKAIVVDLRAGLSELSAGLLLDPRVFRVLVTSVGAQSLRGIEEVAKRLATILGAKSSSTTHFVISHVPVVLRDSELLERARESLIASLVEPDEALEEGQVAEVVVSEYDVDLVTLPLGWSSTLALLDKAGLPQRLRVLVERSPISGAGASASQAALPLAEVRRRLAERAEQQIFAETGEATDFLRIEPLIRLAQDHRTRLPVVVVTGAKGAGKTYTFFQILLAQTWSAFTQRALGGPSQGSEAFVVPLVEPRNVDDAARKILAGSERELNQLFGSDRLSTLELRERLLQLVESKETALSTWRSFWLDAMAWRVGCEPRVAGAGDRLVEHLRGAKRRVSFIVDGLEDVFQGFQDNEVERLALRALVQDVPERLAHFASDEVGLVILVRPDLIHAAVKQNPQQLLARYKHYAIRWSPDAALKLAIWLAVRAGVLALDGTAAAVANLAKGPRDDLLRQLWGNKLGSAKSREARSTAWVIGVLSDFGGQIQARDVVRLIHHAARGSAEQDDRFHDRILDPRSMRKALADWGEEKVRELGEEDRQLAKIFDGLENAPHAKKQVPFAAKELGLDDDRLEYLRQRGIIYDDRGEIYITELVRVGLGFEMGNGARPRVVSLRHKLRHQILRGS